MTSGSKFLLHDSHLLDQLIELVVDAHWAPLNELLLGFLSVRMPLQRSDRDLLVRFVLLEHVEADAKALRLGVVEQELTEVHVSSAGANKNTATLDLNRSDLRTHEVSAW